MKALQHICSLDPTSLARVHLIEQVFKQGVPLTRRQGFHGGTTPVTDFSHHARDKKNLFLNSNVKDSDPLRGTMAHADCGVVCEYRSR